MSLEEIGTWIVLALLMAAVTMVMLKGTEQ